MKISVSNKNYNLLTDNSPEFCHKLPMKIFVDKLKCEIYLKIQWINFSLLID